MKILCKVIEVDEYKWFLALYLCCRCALPRYTFAARCRRRFGNHSNLTADAAPDHGQRRRRRAAEVAKTLRRTDIPFIKSPAAAMCALCVCACDCEYT